MVQSESILNGTLNAKLNRLYQCQSNIVFSTILGQCFTTYPGTGARLQHTRVGRSLRHTRIGAQFNDIPGSRVCVWCKQTGVSHLVVKLHSLYRCRLVRLTPYVCSPTIDGVLTVVMRECIVVRVVFHPA